MNDVSELRREVADLRRVMYGDPPGRGGVAHVVDTMGTTLFGKDRLPGLVDDMTAMKNQIAEIKNAVWRVCAIASFIMVVIQIGLQFLFKLWV